MLQNYKTSEMQGMLELKDSLKMHKAKHFKTKHLCNYPPVF